MSDLRLEPCDEAWQIESQKAWIRDWQGADSSQWSLHFYITRIFLFRTATRRLLLMRVYMDLRARLRDIESEAGRDGADLNALRGAWRDTARKIARFKAHAPAIASELDGVPLDSVGFVYRY